VKVVTSRQDSKIGRYGIPNAENHSSSPRSERRKGDPVGRIETTGGGAP